MDRLCVFKSDDISSFGGANPDYLGVLCGRCVRQRRTDLGVCGLRWKISPKGVLIAYVVVSRVDKGPLGANSDAVPVFVCALVVWLKRRVACCHRGPRFGHGCGRERIDLRP